MKILAIGDFQGKFPEKLKRKLKKEEFDLVVGGGDYGGINDWKPFIFDIFKRLKNGKDGISAEEFFGKKNYRILVKKDFVKTKNVLSEINKLGRKVIFIFGNTDESWYNHLTYKSNKAKKEALSFVRKLKNFNSINYSRKN